MRISFIHWVPMAFSAFISLLALLGFTWTNTPGPRIVFFAFLSLSILFVGVVRSRLPGQVHELLGQIEELRRKLQGGEG